MLKKVRKGWSQRGKGNSHVPPMSTSRFTLYKSFSLVSTKWMQRNICNRILWCLQFVTVLPTNQPIFSSMKNITIIYLAIILVLSVVVNPWVCAYILRLFTLIACLSTHRLIVQNWTTPHVYLAIVFEWFFWGEPRVFAYFLFAVKLQRKSATKKIVKCALYSNWFSLVTPVCKFIAVRLSLLVYMLAILNLIEVRTKTH